MAGSASWWLLLASIVTTVTARRHSYRDADWKPSAATATAADATGPDRWSHLRISHRPTDAPKLDLRAAEPNWKRSHIGIETCGFFPEDGRPFVCPDGFSCENIGNYRDCCGGEDCVTGTFASVCLNYNDPACATYTEGTTCCNGDPGRPFCGTYLWSTTATPNRIFTLFNCDEKLFSGQAILDSEPRVPANALTSTTSSTASSATTSPPTNSPASAGSSTPVGAIVGGVVGGLAVIGLVTLGIFYMFFRNKRVAARGSYIAAAKTEPEAGSEGGSSPSVAMPAAPVPYSSSYPDNTTSPPPPPATSTSPPPVSVSPLSGGTETPAPHQAVISGTVAHPVEAITSPLSKEMPNSPASMEMPTSPAFKEMQANIPPAELPADRRSTVELPG